MEITAPAKINLFLNILDKRPDGYHNIITLFEKIDLCDKIIIEHADSTSFYSDNNNIPLKDGELMPSVLENFRKKTDITDDFRVIIKKNIPIGAGLGGGSSDAAALLKGLNELTGNKLSIKDLCEIASSLGADIPFFLYDSSFGLGEGIGDLISPLLTGISIFHILVKPPFSVSTRDIYNKVSPLSLTKNIGIDRMFTAFLNSGDIDNIAGHLSNDLEDVTLSEHPEIKDIIDEFYQVGAKGALLSGSGPTVFGIFDEVDVFSAELRLKTRFPAGEGWFVRTVKTY